MDKFLQSVNLRKLFWIFFYFFVFCLLIRNSFSYLDPDFAWHLQVGDTILQERAVPSLNYYNYSFTGHWVDHEWLSNLLVSLVHQHLGYLVLSLFFALLIVVVFLLLHRVARRIDSEAFFLLVFLQIFGLVAAAPHFGVRMQESALLFLFLLLSIISRYRRRSDWPVLCFIPPLMYLWACLHGSFLIGFFILGFYVMLKIFERLLFKFWPKAWLDFSGILSWSEIGIFSGVSFLSFVVTLFTPYRAELYSFLFGYRNSVYLSYIQEWLPQSALPFLYPQLFYLAIVVIAVGLYIYYSLGRIKYFKINLWKLALLSLFIILSFKSRRHFPLLFVASFVFLVEVYGQVLKSNLSQFKNRLFDQYLYLFLIICLFLTALLNLSLTRFTNKVFSSYCSDYPCGAVAYLHEHPELNQARLFNNYGWGGYLIRMLPEYPLFIDGRLPQVEFAGHSFLEEYLDFFKDQATLQRQLERYDISLVLIPVVDKPLKVRNWEKILFIIKERDLQRSNNLRTYLSSSPDWQELYRDQTSLIYYKK